MTSKQIKFIKGYLYREIAFYFELPIYTIDNEIKRRFEFEKLSEQDEETFFDVSIYCFMLGDMIGLNLNFPNNEWYKTYDKEKEMQEL